MMTRTKKKTTRRTATSQWGSSSVSEPPPWCTSCRRRRIKGGEELTTCLICTEPAVGYVRRFRGNSRAASYPACAKHYAMAWAYEEFAQDLVRDAVEWLLPVTRS